MKKIKRTAVTGLVLMLVMAMTLSSYAFADNRQAGANMGNGPRGQQQSMNQPGGNNIGQPNGNNSADMGQDNTMMGNNSSVRNDQMRDQSSGVNGNTNNIPNENKNGAPNGNGIPGGNNKMEPDANEMNLMAVEAYLATDNADDNIKTAYDALKKALAGTPGEESTENIETLENTLRDAIDAAGIELSDYADEPDEKGKRINFMAVEAYLATDDADENVQSAYDTLKAALTEEPEDGTDSDISELEAALETALEEANVDLESYMTDRIEDKPMDGPNDKNFNDEPYTGVDMKAVEAYLATDDADENVQSAYDTLKAALTEEPEDGTDSDISELEEALETAIETAGINLDDYSSDEPDQSPMQRMETTQTNGNAESEEPAERENNIIYTILNKILSLFK